MVPLSLPLSFLSLFLCLLQIFRYCLRSVGDNNNNKDDAGGGSTHIQNSTKLKYIIVWVAPLPPSISLSLCSLGVCVICVWLQNAKGLLRLLHLRLHLCLHRLRRCRCRRLTENNDRRILAWQSVNVSVAQCVCVWLGGRYDSICVCVCVCGQLF